MTSTLAVVILIALFAFGAWSRSYIFPTRYELPFGKQPIAAIPVGLFTMGLYGKTSFPARILMILALPDRAALAATHA